MMASASRRVVITGMGLISPLGNTKQAVWESLQAGRSGVGLLQCFSAESFPTHYAGEARGFTGKIEDFGELGSEQKRTIRKGLKVMCREIQMGVAAAQLALQDAGLKPGSYDRDRSGAVFGSDYIMTEPSEFSAGVRNCLDAAGQFDFSRWAADGLPKVTPLWLLKYLPNMPASHIAIYNDLRGPNNSITLREASANLAVSEAYCTILRGNADIMLAGATGTRLHPLRSVHVALQEQLAVGDGPPEEASRPFDLNRRGMVLGEGAATIVLEDMETAKSRGAEMLAELVGYGSSAAVDRQGHPDLTRALENVIVQCLRKAGLPPREVGHVHAHGLSTHKGDALEAAAIRRVFGEDGSRIPVTAAKSYMGNLGAASGMVELITSLLALKHRQLFPILNYQTADPECRIAAARRGGESPGDSVLNISVTPQGQASGVVARLLS